MDQLDKPDAAPASGWERSALEKLALAALAEQRAARRWRNLWRAAWFVLVLGVAWASLGGSGKDEHQGPHTALVELRGDIASDTEARADNVNAALRQAFEDQAAQGVVLLIDSPGGSPVQAGLINDEIRRLKAKHNKPVYAVVEESCASAAYYVAVAADRIYVDKASVVGSIGVLIDGFGFTSLMDKLGIERRLMTAGENKGFLDPFSPQTDKQRAHSQALLNQVHTQFIDAVRKGRGERLKETPETFTGLLWSGQQAVNLGLADDLGSVDSVARDVIKAAELVDYTRRENAAERLVKRLGVAIGQGAVQAARSAGLALR